MLNKLKKIKRKYKRLKKNHGRKEAFYRICSAFSYKVIARPFMHFLALFFQKVKPTRIVFDSRPDYSDNGRAVSDYMLEHHYNDHYEIIWLVANPSDWVHKFSQKNVRFVQRKGSHHSNLTIRAFYYMLTAKYVFFTHSVKEVPQHSKQTYINLWHGCGYKANREGSNIFFDYCLVPGDIFIQTKMEFFHCSADKLLPIGYPRYDVMLRENAHAKKYVQDLLQQSNSTKLLLWMPTYRHSTSKRLNEETLQNAFNIPILDTPECLLQLNAFCKAHQFLLVIKRHYLQKPYDFGDNRLTNIIYLENADLDTHDVQLYELIHYADALISDYSSVAIDYLLLDRPMAFTMDDYEAYTESRGWVFENPLDYMPGHYIYNMSDFEHFLEDIAKNHDPYASKRADVRAKTHNPCDNYCKRILDRFDIKK